jgi:peptidoglycan hydrolase CwlO-like protein
MTDNAPQELAKANNAAQEQATQSAQTLNDLQKNLAEFKGSIVTGLNITKWIGAIAGVALIFLIGIGGWQSFAAIGRLEEKVNFLNYKMGDQEQKLNGLEHEMNEVKKLIEKKRLPTEK